MPHPDAHQCHVGGKGDGGMFRKAVAHVAQIHARAVAVDPERRDPVHEHMGGQQRPQRISQPADPTDLGPRHFFPLGPVLGAGVPDRLPPSVQPERDAGPDVRGERAEDEERLEEGGLVVGSCQEEIGLARGHGPCEERDERGVGDVEAEEGRQEVAGVALRSEEVEGRRVREAALPEGGEEGGGEGGVGGGGGGGRLAGLGGVGC